MNGSQGALQYTGIAVEQLPGSPTLVLFSAPANEIESWAGVPQRRRLSNDTAGTVETAGFQREEKAGRVADLAAFMGNADNVIQNPLLIAVQEQAAVSVNFKPDQVCEIEITEPDLASLPLLELIKRVMTDLESRLPDLSDQDPDPATVNRLRESLSGETEESDAPETTGDVQDASEDDDDSTAATTESAVLLEESQVYDFYLELKARAVVLAESGIAPHELGGFTREYLSSLLKPTVLVDGQHRLKGALQALKSLDQTPAGQEFITAAIDSGATPEEAQQQLEQKYARRLPISLLMSESPAEHVFQFVVVNQKATPMSNALLGTIISTSLTHEEMEPIAERLSRAGIELEGSRAIAYLSRSPESPYRGFVSTGVAGDRPGALPWSVMGGLARLVRNLDGARPYHPGTSDYARNWRRKGFTRSTIVDTSLSESDRMEAWSAIDGLWREFFNRLHWRIREFFGSEDSSAPNYWGSTSSNLFNMVSLHILTSDFFRFITDRVVNEWSDMDTLLDEWLTDVNPAYFARDWRMAGTKKDQKKIKEAWSATWFAYREEGGRLPRVELYNPGGKA